MPHLTKHTWRAHGPRRKDPHAPTKAAAKRGASEDGQALVEFALVLPIVLVILFGVVLFGVALNDWIDETQLASSAVRWAAVNNNFGQGGEMTEAGLKEYVEKNGDNADVRGAKATLCAPEGSTLGKPVEVKLEYNYNWFGLANLLGAKAETPLVSRATYRIETPPATPYHASC